MKVIKPEGKFETCTAIGDHIINGRTVIVNFEDTSADMQRRIRDFIAGLCYATGANIKQSSSFTIIVSPINVQVSSDVNEELHGEAKYTEMF